MADCSRLILYNLGTYLKHTTALNYERRQDERQTCFHILSFFKDFCKGLSCWKGDLCKIIHSLTGPSVYRGRGAGVSVLFLTNRPYPVWESVISIYLCAHSWKMLISTCFLICNKIKNNKTMKIIQTLIFEVLGLRHAHLDFQNFLRPC